MAKKMKFIPVILLFCLCSAKVTPTGHDKLNWITISELSGKMKADPKPVLIDLYTNWCYWCKVMEKKTYSNSRVIEYINDHFYAVKVNAETKDPITWGDRSFNYNEAYKINDFAMFLTSGQPGFPTTTIFADEKSDPASLEGFLEPKDLEPVLKYFGEGYYKTQSFQAFNTNFKATW
ncbi:MAG TPA: DUF255 domain-containing protein [Chitinophagaceae bacterium]|nr:DUF255 domain-containing protein [Chitinophagaceae bacterium]